jgi:hypothetical protein
MPQINTKAQFQKSNWLYIPLSKDFITANPSLETPNNTSYIDNLCIEVERNILINSLGVDLYNELQLAIADDYVNPLYADLEKLVKGDTYDGKVWRGLDYDFNLIACKIKEEFLRQTANSLTGVGVVKVNPQGAENISANADITKANISYITQYQGTATKFPKVKDNTLSWIGLTNSNEVSLFRYLCDKQAVLNWDASNFVFDGMINNWGL